MADEREPEEGGELPGHVGAGAVRGSAEPLEPGPEEVRVRAEREEDERAAKRAKPKKAAPAPVPAKTAKKPNPVKLEKLEARIAEAEAALRAVEEELADPSAWNDPRTAAKSTKRHAEAKKAVEDLYAEYEAVAG